MHAQWNTGYLIAMYITVPLAGICWLIAIGGIFAGFRDPDGMGVSAAIIGVIGALVTGIIGTLLAFPFSSQYHRYVPKSGEVARVGSRFLASDSGGTTQKYVVTFANGSSYGCLDTRCANVDDGDQLTLLCERAFQFNAPSEGWDCNWGRDVKKNGEVIP